jgi:hypothetical protein
MNPCFLFLFLCFLSSLAEASITNASHATTIDDLRFSQAARAHHVENNVCLPSAQKVLLESTEGQQINVFEMQVFSSGRNVAEGKNTSQSSTLKSFVASMATDGDMNTFSHTNDAHAWLQIDLGEVYHIKSLSIANRLCKEPNNFFGCLCRLSDARLSLIDQNGSVVSTGLIGNTCYALNLTFEFDGNCSALSLVRKILF